MVSSLAEIAVDCADPDALARFWCEALGWTVREVEDGLVTIGPDGASTAAAPVLTFARVDEPKTTKNRLHLDLRPVDRDRDAEVERLLALGARRVDVGQGEVDRGDVDWVVLADPEGNELCVLAGRAT